MAGMPPRKNLITSLVIVLVVAFGSLFATLASGWSPRLGLDLAGGLSATYVPQQSNVPQSKLNVAAQILAARVNGLGVSGATVNLQGNDISVAVPGVTNGQQIINEIGATGQLYFRQVICMVSPYVPPTNKAGKPIKPTIPAILPTCNAADQMTEANLAVTPDSNIAAGFYDNQLGVSNQYQHIPSNETPQNPNDPAHQDVILPLLGTTAYRLLCGPEQMTGQSVASAQAVIGTLGDWQVNYQLTSAGSSLWDSVAQTDFHEAVAIDLGGTVESDPIIQPTQSSFSSFGGAGTISGDFNSTTAQNLALDLNYGALPIALTLKVSQTISPTLGHSALIAGLGAGLVGLALVLLYAVGYYRSLGLVILLGLIITASLLWAIISALGHTSIAPSFDLSGVTGLIVSIGITVDSYIVYFERLKDEARAGRTVRTSVDRGFKSAWKTVLAADFVSLLAAVLLFLIAVGTVQGFAFFLGLSTIMDVLVTWYFTRPLVMLLGQRATSSSALSVAAGMGAVTHAGAASD